MDIYYINLASRTDRRAFMERQFATLDLKASRIEALTPAALGMKSSDMPRPSRQSPHVTPGDLACVASHEQAYRSFLADGGSFGLVLEDDALLSSRLPTFLAAFDAAKPIVDMVRIETSGSGTRIKRSAGRIAGIDLAKPFGWEGGAAGYIVSKRAAKFLLDTPATRLRSLDEVLFDPFGALAGELVRWQVLEGLCIQAHLSNDPAIAGLGSSDLRASRWQRRVPPGRIGRMSARLAAIWRREVLTGTQRTFHQLLGARKVVIPFLP